MRLLLTSSGISNPSIHDVLVGLLGKPVAESSALVVPTAIYPFSGGAVGAFQAISGNARSPLVDLGWKSVGVLELTALPSIDREVWAAAVQDADALLVWGGDPVMAEGVGLVDFAIIPHVEYDDHHDVANAEKWAGRLPMPSYAIDDETAIKVIDGTIEVVSEGHWKLFNP
jgi:dipeptidase E